MLSWIAIARSIAVAKSIWLSEYCYPLEKQRLLAGFAERCCDYSRSLNNNVVAFSFGLITADFFLLDFKTGYKFNYANI